MENDNLDNQESLDDDIMQCRADILRSRNRAKTANTGTANTDIADINSQISRDNPVKRAGITANRVNPSAAKKEDESISQTAGSSPAEKKIRIPHFEDLVTSKDQVVDALWESPANPEQEEVTEIGFDLDPDNIVTDEEEQALFGETQDQEPEISGCRTQAEATEEGLEALRKIVAGAKNQAQPEIDELEDMEDIINEEDIENIPDEKADDDYTENFDDTETINLTDLIEPTEDEDTDDFTVEDIQEDSADDSAIEEISAMDDENAPAEQPQANNTMIPKFDLAEQILKEQRQVASKRRQRPAGARNLNIMPIAGTVGQIIERAKKAVATAAEKKQAEPKTKPAPARQETEKTNYVEFDSMEIVPFQQDPAEPVLSVAACRVINESDRLNPFQQDIIVQIVSRDIAKFCGKLTANC
ncbi:MAG: hypothetical protein K9M75_06870 [Phycisphaerae bacterium]|nr:hypothetical protein [Phycisphaerae bacterium]